MPPTPSRPRQVTWCGAVVMVGSVLVLVSAAQVVAGIGTLETRESVEDLLTQPPASGLGLGIETALEILRVSAMVAAASAAAAAILGWYVLQRSASARLGLSVLAVPLFVAGAATGGIVSAAVVAAIVSLWIQPARDWVAGRDPAPRPNPAAATPATAATAGTALARTPTPTTGGAPAATSPWGAPSSASAAPGRRPGAVLAAAVVALTLCGLAVAFCVTTVAVLWLSPDVVEQALRESEQRFGEQGVSTSVVQVATTVMVLLVVVWCVGVAVAAGLALRGVRWARVALLVGAAVSGVVCLLGALGSGALLVPAAGWLVVVLLLVRPEVRSWR